MLSETVPEAAAWPIGQSRVGENSFSLKGTEEDKQLKHAHFKTWRPNPVDQCVYFSCLTFTCEQMELCFITAYLWEQASRVNVGVAVCVQSVVSLCDRGIGLCNVWVLFYT